MSGHRKPWPTYARVLSRVTERDAHWAHLLFEFVAQRYGEDGVRRLLFALRKQRTLTAAIPGGLGVDPGAFNDAFRAYALARFSAR